MNSTPDHLLNHILYGTGVYFVQRIHVVAISVYNICDRAAVYSQCVVQEFVNPCNAIRVIQVNMKVNILVRLERPEFGSISARAKAYLCLAGCNIIRGPTDVQHDQVYTFLGLADKARRLITQMPFGLVIHRKTELEAVAHP